MLRFPSFKAALVLPAAIAIALAGLSGQAAASQAGVNAIIAKIVELKKQEVAPPAANAATPATPTTVSATANELVYAVYNLASSPAFNVVDPNNANKTLLGDLVASALEPVNGNGAVRTDRNTLVLRLIDAALTGSGRQNDPVFINDIVNRLGTVNLGIGPAPGTSKALTSAGKANVIAQALKSSVMNATVAANLATSAKSFAGTAPAATGTTSDLQLQNFVIAALKAITVNGGTQNVVTFFDNTIDKLVGTQAAPVTDATRDAFTIAVAKGAITVPIAAGKVIGGRAADLKAANPATSDAAILTLLQTKVVKDAALLNAIPEAVNNSFAQFSATQRHDDAAASLAAGASVNAKGNIASGAIRTTSLLVNDTPTDVINKILDTDAAGTLGVKTTAQKQAFAGQAARGNAPLAPTITSAVIARIPAVTTGTVTAQTAANRTQYQTVAINVIKAIALDGNTATIQQTSARLITDKAALYATDADKINLTGALATGIGAFNTAVGAATAGVVSTIPAATPGNPASQTAAADLAAKIAQKAIATKVAASVAIAQQVSSLSTTKNFTNTEFATNLSAKLNTAAGAGNVAAGVAVTDPSNAGSITKAVIQTNLLISKSAVAISNTVALNVDIERVADVATSVGQLVNQKFGANPPATQAPILTVANLATIATNLAKAINNKVLVDAAPNVAADYSGGWRNRVDEIGELAAVLTNAAIAAAQAQGANVAPDLNTIALIGTNIFKAVSQTYLLNAGNLLADVSDIARDVAGAIYQTIQTSSLSPAQKAVLLSTTQTGTTLLAKLRAGITAATLKGEVDKALADVLSPSGGSRYETMSVNDPETPSKNV